MNKNGWASILLAKFGPLLVPQIQVIKVKTGIARADMVPFILETSSEAEMVEGNNVVVLRWVSKYFGKIYFRSFVFYPNKGE